MNYAEEVKKLGDSYETFKPEAGSYQIKIVSEPEETYYESADGSRTQQIKMLIEVDGMKKQWFAGKCKTHTGLYGQLMLIGNKHKILQGQTITLLVKRGNDKNEYTILEAVVLMPKKK